MFVDSARSYAIARFARATAVWTAQPGSAARVESAGGRWSPRRGLTSAKSPSWSVIGAAGFLVGCNLHCVFCQNWQISHPADVGAAGEEVSAEQMAGLALTLERRGCANINFVTPTHVAHAVAEAIVLARRNGLTVPVVYNCGGYESVETLRLLEGLVEVYMPDFKYADAEAGRTYSGVPDYPAVAAAALAEMFRQVGPLELDADGLAARGLLVRHLVLPNDIARSRDVIDTVARIAPGAGVNVMGQYRRAYRAGEFPRLLARPARAIVEDLRSYAAGLGLMRVD